VFRKERSSKKTIKVSGRREVVLPVLFYVEKKVQF